MRLAWTPEARASADEAHDFFLLRESPQAAERFEDDLAAALEQVLAWPESGREVPELGSELYREVFTAHFKYRIVYRRKDDTLEVWRVHPMLIPLDLEILRSAPTLETDPDFSPLVRGLEGLDLER